MRGTLEGPGRDNRADTMGIMANRSRPTTSNPARHLTPVPGEPQPPLWDTAELSRLAYLRRMAIETGRSAEAIWLIEAATTAEEAIGSLRAAGLMPDAERSLDDVLSWFAPLLEPGCDPVTAEIAASQFIAELRRGAGHAAHVAEPLLIVIGELAGHPRDEALAALRAFGAVGPGAARAVALAAAARMAAAGAADMPWASELGAPKPGRCFGYEDVYGEQRSLVLPFSYGRRWHAIVLLIGYMLGGGLKDLYVCDYPARLRTRYRAAGRDPDVRYREFDGAAARAIVSDALARPPCPADRDQAERVAHYVELLRARVAALPLADPAPRSSPGADGTTAARKQAPRNIHRLKVTLRGSKPPIWRRFEVPSDISLQGLHTVIQAGFGWQDCHVHVFETTAGQYGIRDPDVPEVRGEASKRLSAVADWPGDHFEYEYDFGDAWRHAVTVEAVQPAEPGVAYPRCTGGKRACPPDDCGGIAGYYRMLAVLTEPDHEDHQATLAWLGLSSAAEFDPDRFEAGAVNEDLAGIARVLVRA